MFVATWVYRPPYVLFVRKDVSGRHIVKLVQSSLREGSEIDNEETDIRARATLWSEASWNSFRESRDTMQADVMYSARENERICVW